MNVTTVIPPQFFIPGEATKPGLRFRLAQHADGQALHEACYPQYAHNRFREQFHRALRRQTAGRGFYLVAEWLEPVARAGQIAGAGQLLLYPHSAEIAELAVTAVYRRQGIGTAIMMILTNLARHVGLTGLEISVARNNSGALLLYQRLGFLEDRRLQLPGDPEPAIVLHKKL